MTDFVKHKRIKEIPRIPLGGYIDLTYRCNLNCRHCWIRIPANSYEGDKELSFDEIREILDEAKSMGCRNWYISGGEPMLRPDFPEIFEYIINQAGLYSLNTNGTLITPEIARLMKRKGQKWIALYGATHEVYDHITRVPGSFEAAMRGFKLLKEAGAGFMVQIVPMKDNYHQYQDMVKLAESLSPHWRVGITWLYLSASGDPVKNKEIKAQRLNPRTVVDLMQPGPSFKESFDTDIEPCSYLASGNQKPFAACINAKREFYIDPYGQMTFCGFMKDPSFLYDIRKESFREGWERFIPALADKITIKSKPNKSCLSCELKEECTQCPVYSYLEHRNYHTPVTYLCKIEKEIKRYQKAWNKSHRRYYRIAGLTIRLDADLPITDSTFAPALKSFEVKEPGDDIVINHHFSIPDIDRKDLGKEIYRRPPWSVYKKGNSWIYLVITPMAKKNDHYKIAIFNQEYTRARIYSDSPLGFCQDNLNALTLFSTDQILLARILAHKQGILLHSSGVIFQGHGLLFVGHSDAGKSTMVKMLKDQAEILCDDRNIIRKWPDGYRVHGTWSHGEVPLVSPASAPLKAIFFLVKSNKNKIVPVKEKKESIKKILGCLIKPLQTEDWWETMFSFVEELVQNVPCCDLYFDQTGRIVDLLKQSYPENSGK